MQTGKDWVRHNILLFLQDMSFWYFLSNSLVWLFLVMMPIAAPCGHLRITSATEVLKAKVQHNLHSGAGLDYFLR